MISISKAQLAHPHAGSPNPTSKKKMATLRANNAVSDYHQEALQQLSIDGEMPPVALYGGAGLPGSHHIPAPIAS